MEQGKVLLGTGRLSWHARERRTDRYGYVGLLEYGDSQSESKWAELDFPESLDSGDLVRLVAEVVETRQSTHIGDLFHGFFPETPEVGEEILLGVGGILFSTSDGFLSVGLEPIDGREHFKLDPKMLYRAHEQTVNLFAIPISDSEKESI